MELLLEASQAEGVLLLLECTWNVLALLTSNCKAAAVALAANDLWTTYAHRTEGVLAATGPLSRQEQRQRVADSMQEVKKRLQPFKTAAAAEAAANAAAPQSAPSLRRSPLPTQRPSQQRTRRCRICCWCAPCQAVRHAM